MNITLNRGEASAIPFTITDAANGLLGKRVTWAVSVTPNGQRVLTKASALGASTADVVILTQLAGSITGAINVAPADYANFTKDGSKGNQQYFASLWIDDGSGNDRCVSVGGEDTLVIAETVARA